MIRTNLQLSDKEILQRNTVAQLVRVASRYEATIMIEHGDKTVNAKSMLGLLSLGSASAFTNMTLVAEGTDEAEAVDAVLQLFHT